MVMVSTKMPVGIFDFTVKIEPMALQQEVGYT